MRSRLAPPLQLVPGTHVCIKDGSLLSCLQGRTRSSSWRGLAVQNPGSTCGTNTPESPVLVSCRAHWEKPHKSSLLRAQSLYWRVEQSAKRGAFTVKTLLFKGALLLCMLRSPLPASYACIQTQQLVQSKETASVSQAQSEKQMCSTEVREPPLSGHIKAHE